MQSIKQNEYAKFVDLYKKAYPLLLRFGIKLYDSPEFVKDCIHEMFITLWTKPDSLANVRNINAYLCGMLKHTIFQALKKKREFTMDNATLQQLESSGKQRYPLVSEENTFEQLPYIIKKAVTQLSKGQREIVEMKYLMGLDYEEIEQITDLDNKRIRSQMHKALKKLKNILPFCILATL
ncbi:RNA polymerase sigma factor [Fulvitalea axinellae]|uniref:RNA polymerase sigma factor n=1 Tax=Fulvitalea axinellae TaxID=1182444 RepID=UPI0030CA1A20